MRRTKKTNRAAINSFLTWTIVYTLPAYVMIALTATEVILSKEHMYSFIPLSLFGPIGAAVTVTKRNGGRVKRLLKKAFDIKKITSWSWGACILVIVPALFFLAWGVSFTFGLEMMEPAVSVYLIPLLMIAFFTGALGEEVGWMGFLFGALRKEWSFLKSALILGVFWAVWHVPMYLFGIGDLSWLLMETLSLLGLRLIIVWFYAKTGKSVFSTILIHMIYNVCMATFPVNFASLSGVILLFALVLFAYELSTGKTNSNLSVKRVL